MAYFTKLYPTKRQKAVGNGYSQLMQLGNYGRSESQRELINTRNRCGISAQFIARRNSNGVEFILMGYTNCGEKYDEVLNKNRHLD